MKSEPPMIPEFIVLNVKHVQSRPKITRILNMTREDSIAKIKKERPRTLYQLSFNSQHLSNLDLGFSTAMSNFKQLKSLIYLKVDFALLLHSPRITRKIIASLRHSKNPPVLNVHASLARTPFISPRMVRSLAQSLNNTESFHHNFKIELSLWREEGLDANQLKTIISNFSEIKILTSVDLTFEYSAHNSLHVHELVAGFKESESLSTFSITLIQFSSPPLTSIVESLS